MAPSRALPPLTDSEEFPPGLTFAPLGSRGGDDLPLTGRPPRRSLCPNPLQGYLLLGNKLLALESSAQAHSNEDTMSEATGDGDGDGRPARGTGRGAPHSTTHTSSKPAAVRPAGETSSPPVPLSVNSVTFVRGCASQPAEAQSPLTVRH